MGTGEDYMLYLADMMIEELRTENAKLRELVRNMAHVLTEQYCGSDGHSDCANWDACGLYRKCEERLHACSMWYRMEKLGIEVD